MDMDRPIVASFSVGSAELYEWMHLNEQVVMRRTETTNNPAKIALQPRMTSVNTALQVDLFGQANASRRRRQSLRRPARPGDFIVGALHSPGGQAIMALRSDGEPYLILFAALSARRAPSEGSAPPFAAIKRLFACSLLFLR